MERSDKPNRLQQKYPAPVDWHQFEKEKLESYTQKEVLPFLFSAVSSAAPLLVVKKILDEKEITPNVRDAKGTVLLTHAILAQNTPAAVVAVNRGAKVTFEMDRPGYTGEYDEYRHALTPWQAACIIGKEKYLRLVYEKMEPQDQQWVIKQPMFHLNKKFPLDYALTHKKPELAQFLCSCNKYLITEGYDFERAANAAGWHDATYLKMLFEQIETMLFAGGNKEKLLGIAIRANNTSGVAFLIRHDARPDAPMCVEAAIQKNKEIFDMIQPQVRLGAQFNTLYDLPIKSCFTQADRLRSIQPIEWLLAAGANADEQHPDAQTQPIHLIARSDIDLPLKKSLVQLFRSKGIRLDTCDQDGNTLLHHVCHPYANQNHAFMFYLLDLGADANAKNKDKQTPFLLFCARNHKPKYLRFYIQHYQPEVTVKDRFGNTPLIHAADKGKKAAALIKVLLAAGANIPQSVDAMLHKTCSTLNVNLAKELIESYHAQVNHLSDRKNTTIIEVVTARNFAHKTKHKAKKVCRAKLELIDLLKAHGAIIDAQDDEGNTALHYADSPEIVSKLLEHGASTAITNKQKQTALEMALTGYLRSTDSISLLLAYTNQRPIVMSTGQTLIEYVLAEGRSSWSRSVNTEFWELVARHTTETTSV
jgi:ankyrin repeat protein